MNNLHTAVPATPTPTAPVYNITIQGNVVGGVIGGGAVNAQHIAGRDITVQDMAVSSLSQHEIELAYHIWRVAGESTLEAVFRPIAEKYHTIVRNQSSSVVEVSQYPPTRIIHAPWTKGIGRILSRLCHAQVIATKAPPTIYLSNPPADEYDGVWFFITQKGIDLVRHEMRYGDLGRCLSADGLVVNWDMVTAVTNPPDTQQRNHTNTRAIIKPDEFLKQLDKVFDMDDLRELCFNISVDFDNLARNTKKQKFISLIQELERKNRITDLLEHCKQVRPQIEWEGFVRS